MGKLSSFQFFHNSHSDTLDVILHGGSRGIESSLIEGLYKLSKNKKHSVLAFNFPYLERGEENSSGAELREELATLRSFLNFANARFYTNINLIGKSLGAIVAGFYLKSLPLKLLERYSVVVLGYIAGEVNLKSFPGRIVIIQGEKDRFGDIETVKKDLKGTSSKNIRFYEIKGADHSFRIPETKEPVYENKVIELLKSF